MSTGGRCALRATVSLHRRVSADEIPPCSCIFPVLYRKPAIVNCCRAPVASGLLPPRPGQLSRRDEKNRIVRRFAHNADKQKDGRSPARLSATEIAESSVFRLLLGIVFLARLAVLALQRRAEDVAEAGAAVRGAVLGHRLLLLLDLARLDREAELARRLVDRRHLGVDLLADGEAVGALLAAIARQVGFADKARHAVPDGDLDAAIDDRRDGCAPSRHRRRAP